MGNKAKCPECEEYFELEDDLEVGDITYCEECGEELEIIKLNPVKLAVKEEE